MKPAPFAYARPHSLDEALQLLAENADDGKVLAGGQSLLPILNFRMLRPSVLIDINRIADLSFLREEETGLRLGALTRHQVLATSPLVRQRFPVLSAAMEHVAHLAIRNRGTCGGSLTHADPAAEWPMMAILLDAGITTKSSSATHTHAARDFFLGPLTSAVGEDEIVTEIFLPYLPDGTGWGFEEFAQRSGDFAIAAVAATVTIRDGVAGEVRLAAMGVDSTPLRFPGIEDRLTGNRLTTTLVHEAARQASAAVEPNTDLKASADYRRHLVATLAQRVLNAAWARAGGALQ